MDAEVIDVATVSPLDMDTILANREADQPTCASVMDYLTPVFATDPEAQARFQSTTLGPYDYWAIEYGYTTEDKKLAEIAARHMVIILLNSFGKLTPFGDSNRLRKWIEN